MNASKIKHTGDKGDKTIETLKEVISEYNIAENNVVVGYSLFMTKAQTLCFS